MEEKTFKGKPNMITPFDFKLWYKQSDLKLIAGQKDQEIDIHTDLWNGFKVYLHWYKSHCYWNQEENCFDKRCEVFKVHRKFFTNKYELLSPLETMNEIDSSTELIEYKRATNLMGEKLTSLVEYMNSIAPIRKKIMKYMAYFQTTPKLDRLATVDEVNEYSAKKRKANELEKLLFEIEEPTDRSIPLENFPTYVNAKYVQIMSNGKALRI